MTATVSQVNVHWTEPAATANCPIDGNPPDGHQDCAAGAWTPTPYGPVLSTDTGVNEWFSFDVTADVAAIVASPTATHEGWAVRAVSGFGAFSSRESATNRPRLVINYGPPNYAPEEPGTSPTAAPPPPIDRSAPTHTYDAMRWLLDPDRGLQWGFTPGVIDPDRAAVVRGRLIDPSGNPLSGIDLAVLGRSELGRTRSRIATGSTIDSGYFELLVNGGGPMVFEFTSASHITAQRTVDVPWNGWLTIPDIVMTANPTVGGAPDPTSRIVVGPTTADGRGANRSMRLPAPERAPTVAPRRLDDHGHPTRSSSRRAAAPREGAAALDAGGARREPRRMRVPRFLLSFALGWAALLLTPHDLLAQGLDEEARGLFAAGEVAYGEGRYESALEYFQRAFELSGRPLLLYNIGSAAEHVRRDAEALAAFERYLAEAGPDAPFRSVVAARVEILRAAVASTPDDDPRPEESPDPAEPASTSGSGSRDASGAGADPAAWVLVATGGAVAVAGAILVGVGYADAASVTGARDGVTWPEIAGAVERAPILQGAGFASIGVGVALAAVGIVWGATSGGGEATSAVLLGPGSVTVRGRF